MNVSVTKPDGVTVSHADGFAMNVPVTKPDDVTISHVECKIPVCTSESVSFKKIKNFVRMFFAKKRSTVIPRFTRFSITRFFDLVQKNLHNTVL